MGIATMAHWNVSVFGMIVPSTTIEFYGTGGASMKIAAGDTFDGKNHAGDALSGNVTQVAGSIAELQIGPITVTVREVPPPKNMPAPQRWQITAVS